MNTLNRSTLIALLMSLALAGCLRPPAAHALQTQEVELGSEAGYDGSVAIARDESGRMTFRDSELSAGVTLRELYELSSGPDFIDIGEIITGRLEVDELELDGHTLRNPNTGGDIHLQTLGDGLLLIFADTQIAADLEITGSVNLGDASTDVIAMPGSIEGSLRPNTPASSQLGTEFQPWGILYLDSLILDGNTLSAADGTGLALRDDAGNLGLFVEDGGHVGVGTQTPGDLMHIRGSFGPVGNNLIVGNGAVADTSRIYGFVSTSWDTANYAFTFENDETANAHGNTLRIIGGGGSGNGHSASNILSVGDNNGSVDFLVRGDGNVGIGTATPAHPLEFASGAMVTGAGVFVDASSRSFKTRIADEPTTGPAGEGRVGPWDLIDEIPIRRFQYREMIDRTVLRQTPDGPTTETVRVRGAAGDGVVRTGFIYEDLPPQLRHGEQGVSATEMAAVAIAAARENKRRVLRLEQALARVETRLRALEVRLPAAESHEAGGESGGADDPTPSGIPAVPLLDEAGHR